MAPKPGPIAWSPAPGRSDASSARGRRTREKILRSAMVVFGRRGFADTAVLDIAEHAGLASGTVYQYFEDKSDVFRCLLQDLTERLHLETRMPAGEDGRLVVHESMLRYLQVYREYAPIFRAWWELLEPPTEFTAAWVALHEKSRTEMVGVVTDGQRRGIIDKRTDPEITADLIVAAFERPAYSKIVLGWDDEYDDERLADLMSRLLGSPAAA
ncbi:MAG: putative TetR family transcriptional regulator [Solirubrobacterales bacterium]|nr:putative TetR family transcriptional regulator [Solirubrobacterales bacterium]